MLRLAARIAPLFVLASVLAIAILEFRSPPPAVVAGVQLLAVALAIWARSAFPPRAFRAGMDPGSDTLVRGGPYAWVRHPMYAAALTFVWAGLFAWDSLWAAAVGVAVTALVSARVILEERLLRERFPDYTEYARSTKAVIPFLL